MDRRTPQRTGYTPAKQTQVSSQDLFDTEYDDIWPSRMPSSTRRYRSDVRLETGRVKADVQSTTQGGGYPITQPGRRSSIPARSTATQTNVQTTGRRGDAGDDITSRDLVIANNRHNHEKTHFHWLFYVGVAMLVMTLGWAGLSAFNSWWQVTQDDLRYGRPRTFQIDQMVGHNDSATNRSHFIALNLNRHVQVIEFPGGDSAKAKIYIGPVLVGADQELAAVTLSFKDVNGDGKLDMIMSVQDSRFVFINENGAFRPLRPGESIHL